MDGGMIALVLLLAVGAWILVSGRHEACGRLRMVAWDSAGDEREVSMGLGAMLAALHAHVRAGASLAQARARVMGEDRIGAVDPYGPNAIDIATMVRCCAGKDERVSHVRTVADELAMACRLSASLGCGAARCCAAVSASYHRLRTLDDLRSNAFAMPKATVRLLSVLPFATVALGYVLGARPVEFLIGSTSGLVCLGLGMGAYALGMAWIRRLMNHCSDIRDLVNVDTAGRRRR